MDIWYQSILAVLGTYRTIFQRKVNIEGLENIPSGPKILIGNHANVTDAFVLPTLFKEKLNFFVQEEFFSVKVLGSIFKKAEQIPVVPGEGHKAIAAAKKYLDMGNSVVIFPEGVLNHGKDFHRARSGAVILASKSGAPLVPMGFYVPDKYMRTFTSNHYKRRTMGRWQMGGTGYLQFGKPMLISESLAQANDYQNIRVAAERIMKYVNDLVEMAKATAGST